MNLPPDLERWAQENAIGTPTTFRAPSERPQATKAPPSDGRVFYAVCEAHGLPRPEPEYQFAKEIGRKWAFDYLFANWLAVEIEGAVWKQGRHTRGQGFIDDMEKYNNALLLGYGVLRFTPEQMQDGSAFPIIKQALAQRHTKGL